ncbi:MAG: hypothetical protein IJY28_01285 [Clostridia bacterium]|nr:hypothetical protein [Clostridia bacterium]
MEEMKELLGKEWVRCPHCGIKNETDAETCFLCGKPMQNVQDGEISEPEKAPEPVKVTAAATEGKIVFNTDENEEFVFDTDAAEIPAPTAVRRVRHPMKPWQRMLCWCAGVTAGLLLLGASAAQIVYTTSPAHDAMQEFRQSWYHKASVIFNDQVRGKWPHAQIMEREVEKYFAEMAVLNQERKLGLSEYAYRVSEVLKVYDYPPKQQTLQKMYFQAILDRVYEDYMAAEPKITLADAREVFLVIQGYGLHTQSRTQVQQKYDAMIDLSGSREDYETAVLAEEGERYETAIRYYRQVIESDASYAKAQEGLRRCGEGYRQQMLDKVNAAKPVTEEEIRACIDVLEEALRVLPEDDKLNAALQQQKQLLAKARKEEALHFAQNAGPDEYIYALNSLQAALYDEQNAGDLELTAELERIWQKSRAHLMANLRKNMEQGVWKNTETLWCLLDIRADAELQALLEQFSAYQSHALYVFAGREGERDTPGVKNFYWNDPTNPDDKGNIAPVRDAAGNKHDPFNLWQFSATRSQTARLTVDVSNSAEIWCSELYHISFTIAPAASCGSGTARLQIRTSLSDGTKVLYTSPKLTRNSKPVQVDLALDNVNNLEIKLIADSTPDGKPMVMLIDGGWIESNREDS